MGESRGMATPALGGAIIARQIANRSPSLRGTLADLGIGEVLTLLSSSSATGRLVVTTADRPRHLDLREGDVVGASGSIGRPLEPGRVREGIAEVMLDLVMLEDAPFEFGAHDDVPDGGEAFTIRTVLDDVNQRVDDWRKIAAVIPSTSVVASLADSLPEGSEEVRLDRESWRVVAALDGKRTVGDVMLLTGMGAFEACGILHRLATAGAVSVQV